MGTQGPRDGGRVHASNRSLHRNRIPTTGRRCGDPSAGESLGCLPLGDASVTVKPQDMQIAAFESVEAPSCIAWHRLRTGRNIKENDENHMRFNSSGLVARMRRRLLLVGWYNPKANTGFSTLRAFYDLHFPCFDVSPVRIREDMVFR